MGKFKLIFLLSITLVLNGFVHSTERNENAAFGTLENSLQKELNDLVRDNGFPGANLAVVLPDNHIIAVAAGKADLESGEKMTTRHRLFSGSIGKTYVSAVALQLVKENKLNLDTLISAFFKNEPWFSKLPNGAKITVRMLMNHTGGLPRYVMKKELWDAVRKNPDKEWTPEERLAFILGDPPVHPAGEGWSYSDTDYILVGMIIEKITGHTYYQELENRILKPLNLKNTTPANKRRIEGLCAGYTNTTDPFNMPHKVFEKGLYVFNPQLEWTGGGLVTTPSELALWAKRLYGGDVLDSSIMKELYTFVKDKPGVADNFIYGLGVMAWKTQDGIAYGHSGFVPGYQSVVQYFPQGKYSIALQINTDRTTGKFKKSMELYVPLFETIVNKFMTSGRQGPLDQMDSKPLDKSKQK